MTSFLAKAFLEAAFHISIAPGGYTPLDPRFSAAAAVGGVTPPGLLLLRCEGRPHPGTKGQLLLLLRPIGTFQKGFKEALGDMGLTIDHILITHNQIVAC